MRPPRQTVEALLIGGGVILATALGWLLPLPNGLGAPLVALVAAGVPVILRENARRGEKKAQIAFVQEVIDCLPHPIFIRDVASRFVLVNRAYADYLDRTPDRILGRTPYQLVAEQPVADYVRDEDRAVFAGQAILKETTCLLRADVEPRHLVVSKQTCRSPAGTPYLVGSYLDVSPWRHAERELQEAVRRESELRARTQDYIQRLIDVIPHPVYVKNADGRYTLVNEAFVRDRRSTREAMIGSHWMDQEKDPASAFCLTVQREDDAVLNGLHVLREEHKAHPVTGRERFRVVAKGCCLDANSQPVIVCAAFDVTDWRIAEARLAAAKETAERANEAKSQFLANMSHELRTPMHAILSFARLGVARGGGNDKLHHYFNRIVVSGERLLRLLNDLLDLSKLESGRAHPNLRPVDLRILVQEVLNEFSALLESRGISVTLLCQEHTVAKADLRMIGQVLRNLLSNAIKFSPGQSVVEIAVLPEQDRDMVELRVRDQGIGIPEEELEAVFDKFYQGARTRSEAGGTGLGLAISKEIVKAHGGHIQARNRPDGGAEFILHLPACMTTLALEASA